jgi:hypothetical protein
MPCDFSVGGIMKNKVFSQRPMDLEHLRTITEAQFENMDEDKNYASPLLIAQLNVAEGVSNRMANILKHFCNAMRKT